MTWSVEEHRRGSCALALLDECEMQVQSCTLCSLSTTRKNAVFGEGDRRSRLMFVGEGPGAEEDESGRPFIGRAGQLLSQILQAAGIAREEVFITNVVKCRPPGNRTPLPDEEAACDVYLQTQLLAIAPAILVLLGATPTKWLLKTAEPISKIRGRWVSWHGIDVMPMFHPSYLLRYPDGKKVGSPKHLSWLDIQEVKRRWDEVRSNDR